MTYEEIYANADSKTLIRILEQPDDYNSECVFAVEKIFNSLQLKNSEKKQLAKEYMVERIALIMNEFTPYKTKIQLPTSNYLKRKEVIEILKRAFDKWMQKRKGREIDLWDYIIGAI